MGGASATKIRFLVGRLGTAIPSLIGVVVVTFILTRALPGDPALYFAGPAATEESVEEIRRALGLDRSVFEQFLIYVEKLAQGDLGVSLSTGQPVIVDLLERLPASLELTLCGLVIAIATSLVLGVAAATRPGTWIDHLCRVVSTAGISLPAFFTGVLLLYVFYYLIGIAPAPFGRLDAFLVEPERVTGFLLIDSLLAGELDTFYGAVKQLILPSITLALAALAPLARMTRATMLGVLSSDFIRTARASGLPRRKVLYTYALQNALLPVITVLGLVLSFMLGANVLVEKVFSWPGVGTYALEALIASDYAPVQGFVLMLAILYVLLNLGIDILYGLVDPRVGFAS